MEGERPDGRRYVLIAAPHTSNWDMPAMLAMAFVHDVRVRWMGKHTLFEGVFGGTLKWLGGMPIVRHRAGGIVDQMVTRFAEETELELLVPAEGTRSYVEYWKSGFYHIANKANVPVCLSYLDFGTKRTGFGPLIHLTGDVRADMDRIREFYGGMRGLHEGNVGRIRLREEDVDQAAE